MNTNIRNRYSAKANTYCRDVSFLRLGISYCLGNGAILAWCVFAPPAVAQEGRAPSTVVGAPRPNEVRIVKEFRVARDGDALMLPVTLAQDVRFFLVDTGTSVTTFDKALSPLLGRRTRSAKVMTPDGVISTDLYAAPDAQIGSFVLSKDSSVDVADLESVREIHGYEIYGILGMDFLSRHVCRIDCDTGTFQFLEPGRLYRGKRFPIIYRRQALPYFADAMVGPLMTGFQIDTGAINESGGLGSHIFDLLLSQGGISDVRMVPSVTMAGLRTRRFGRVKELSIDGFQQADLDFIDSDYNLLGLSYWARFVVTFDFPNAVMYLEKGKQFGIPDVRDASGLHIAKVRGDVIVSAVALDSPGSRAGIREGDTLVKIGHYETSKNRLFDLRRALCKKGQDVDILFRRDAGQRIVTLNLEK